MNPRQTEMDIQTNRRILARRERQTDITEDREGAYNYPKEKLRTFIHSFWQFL